jgi:prepilin-type N-terminal cleavage/methylation domain-containing protein
MYNVKRNNGFTLLEVLLVVAALAILAGTVILAINPAQQLAQTRDAQRHSDATTLLNAVYQYAIDNNGSLPAGITSDLQVIGTSSGDCTVMCGAIAGEVDAFLDNTQATFNQGAYTDMQYDTINEWIELTAQGRANGTGMYTSSIKDVGVQAIWRSITWTPTWPFSKELPDNKGTESGYPNGNVDMTDSELLLHFNEAALATTFIDTSGESHTGTCATGCPTAGASGIFNTAVDFDGADDRLRVGTLDLTGDFTVSAWIKPDTTTCSSNNDCEIIQSSSQMVFDFNDGNEYRICSVWPSCVTVPVSVITVGEWQHVAAVRSGNVCTLYRNGEAVPGGTGVCSTDPQAGIFYVGGHSGNNRFFDGSIDELAILGRAVDEEEMLSMYRRGALQVRYRVRSCDDLACDTESFVGPDGTTATYFSEVDNDTLSPYIATFTSLADDQYFQYRAYFETLDTSYSPEVSAVRTEYSIGGYGGEQTLGTCIDLSDELTNGYITQVPIDPRYGEAENTYYAIKRSGSDRIEVKACGNEEDIISVSR